MHEDDLRRLHAAIADVWESGGRRFVTIGIDEIKLWARINLAWPFQDEPGETLADLGAPLPGAAFVASWAPGGTAILGVGDLLQDEVVALLESLVDDVLEADEVAVRVDADR